MYRDRSYNYSQQILPRKSLFVSIYVYKIFYNKFLGKIKCAAKTNAIYAQ